MPRITVVFRDVQRFVVSYRPSRWDDDGIAAVTCTKEDLPAVLHSFGGAPIYGWEFFDTPEAAWARWSNRLSLDEQWQAGRGSHTLELFQEGRREGHDEILEFRAWFDRVEIYDVERRPIPLDEFAADGKRWWDGLHAGDARTASAGIYPKKSEGRDPDPTAGAP